MELSTICAQMTGSDRSSFLEEESNVADVAGLFSD